MNKLKKLASYMAVALIGISLAGGFLKAVQQLDGYVEAGGLHVLSNGQRFFSVGSQNAVDNALRVAQTSSTANGIPTYTIVVSTNGGVQFNGNAGSAAPGPVGAGVDLGGVGNGGYYPTHVSTATSAQLGAQVPRFGVGELVFNASRGTLCVSTGTSQGGFANAISTSGGTALPAANTSPCYP